jgi:flagellar hook assembly protein FlgD
MATYDGESPPSAATTIRIYNVTGELVREADLGTLSPGAASWVWDGTTRSGRFAGSGIYFVRLVAGSYTETAKMVLLK